MEHHLLVEVVGVLVDSLIPRRVGRTVCRPPADSAIAHLANWEQAVEAATHVVVVHWS